MLSHGGQFSRPLELTVDTDERFDGHYTALRQVFAYVTDQCNLRCVQCYYKPWLRREAVEIDFSSLVALLHKFRELGAEKLSLLGGEPTLYGRGSQNPPLEHVVRVARDMGYSYVRVVTSGASGANLAQELPLDLLDELTVSVDGDTPEIHDRVRGTGAFDRAMACLEVARGRVPIQITTCVHQGNIGWDGDGRPLLDRAIQWSTVQGASLVNFHPVIKMGIARDAWTGEIDIAPDEWIGAYQRLRRGIDDGAYSLPVRAPIRFVTRSMFEDNPRALGYCPVKLGERVEFHANGQIHSCALDNGTPISIAKFGRSGTVLTIDWVEHGNELAVYGFDNARPQACPVMKRDFGDLLPLCISLKPGQVSVAPARSVTGT